MPESLGSSGAPTRFEHLFNRLIGMCLHLGFGPAHMWLLEVRGRKSGKLFSTPVDLLAANGALYLVAPRGRTQWVRNAEASGEVTLRRGRRAERYDARAVSDAQKPEILKSYLDRFRREVQQFFPVVAGSPAGAFVPLAGRYPVFEVILKR